MKIAVINGGEGGTEVCTRTRTVRSRRGAGKSVWKRTDSEGRPNPEEFVKVS